LLLQFPIFASVKQSMKKYLLPICCLLFVACHNNGNTDNQGATDTDSNTTSNTGIATPQTINVNVIGIYPHDTSAYTQGLELYNGKMYEGTGDYETSSLRITDAKTGKVEQKHVMGSADIFGEGITIFKGKIYQLTWLNHFVNEYDISNINKPIKTFEWPNEGWGLTHDSIELIVSDGSANLYFVDPNTFKVKNQVQVTDNNGPVDQLNELEYVDGYAYANVYQTDRIVKVDLSNGHVVGEINIPGMLNQFAPGQTVAGRTDVLNGLAWDSTNKVMYITGKRWPKMFEVKLN
jgi:glutamine cyclotransferase